MDSQQRKAAPKREWSGVLRVVVAPNIHHCRLEREESASAGCDCCANDIIIVITIVIVPVSRVVYCYEVLSL